MHKTTQVAARVALLGLVMLVAASPAFAQKGKPAPPPSPVPIVATFTTDATGANVMSDGSPYDWYTIYADGTTEGAYINTFGGIDINLAGRTSRQMTFRLDEPVGSTSTNCYIPAGLEIVTNVVDFRFNPYGSADAILAMTAGQTTTNFAGVINYVPAATNAPTNNGWSVTRVSLMYGADSVSPGTSPTFTKMADGSWVLASDAYVSVQCVVSNGKRSVFYRMDPGQYHHAAFSLTMTLPQPTK